MISLRITANGRWMGVEQHAMTIMAKLDAD